MHIALKSLWCAINRIDMGKIGYRMIANHDMEKHDWEKGRAAVSLAHLELLR